MKNDIEQLRKALEQSRAAGVDFDSGWKSAMRDVKNSDTRHALNYTMWSFASAYTGSPATGRERAAAELVHLLEEGE